MPENAGAVQGDPQHPVRIEQVLGSDIPVQLRYVEMVDGVYVPIGLRIPPGAGPFPLVLFAYGNGGGGMAVVREFTQNVSFTRSSSCRRATPWRGCATALRSITPMTRSAS